MIPLSVVISARAGLSRCLGLDFFLAGADAGLFELIVVDGAEDAKEHRHSGLRHLLLPGASVFELRRAGLSNASKDWILLTEEHCRPLSNLLDAYRNAIQKNPEVDLISGAVTNDTSSTPWGWASFLIFRHDFWPASGKTPGQPTISNLIIRKAAILESELASEGAFDCATIPRLARSGRYMHCRDAVEDHVDHHSTCLHALITNFHSARAGAALARRTAPWGARALLIRIVAVPVNRILAVPARVMYDVRGTSQGRWSLLPRLMALGLASACGPCSARAALFLSLCPPSKVVMAADTCESSAIACDSFSS